LYLLLHQNIEGFLTKKLLCCFVFLFQAVVLVFLFLQNKKKKKIKTITNN